jgi:WD40 repeat protein
MKALKTQLGLGWHVAYGASGRELLGASWCDGACFQVWRAGTFEEVQRHTAPSSFDLVVSCLFEPCGAAFLRENGYWPAGQEWPTHGPPLPEHAKVLKKRSYDQGWLGFGPDGKTHLHISAGKHWGTPRAVALWDFTGKCVRPFPRKDSVAPRYAAFSPVGGLLVCYNANIRAWLHDLKSGEQVGELEHPMAVRAACFSPAAPLLATAAGRVVRLWDARERRCLHQFPAFGKFPRALCFSPDGRLLAAGNGDGHVRLWDVASGRELANLALGHGEVNEIAFAPDGTTAAAACKKQAVVVWDVDA